MKKWLVALIALMISAAVFFGVAFADSTTPDTTETGSSGSIDIVSVMDAGTDENGVYYGNYYYRVEFNLSYDAAVDYGMGPIDADEPDEIQSRQVGRFYYDNENNVYYTLVFPDENETNPEDAFFVGYANSGEWTKLKFRHDTSKTNGPRATVTNTIAPDLDAASYTVTWAAADEETNLSGADAYYVHLETPDGRDLPGYFAAGDSRSLALGTGNTTLVNRYGEENLKNLFSKYGGYNIWIETLKGGKISESDRWYFYIPETAPVLMLNGYDNDPRYVQQNDDGSVSINFHQMLQFRVYAPGAAKIDIYSLDSLEKLNSAPDSAGYPLTDDNKWVDFYWDPYSDGWYDFEWIRNWVLDNRTAFDQYLVAVARYDESKTHDLISEPMTIHVSMEQAIDGEITYKVPGAPINTISNGVPQVPRDGFLYVDIDNDNNNADFYGLYIAPGNEATDLDKEWVTTSRWINKSEGETTRVQLTVPQCEAGKDYQVRVFGIKYGAAQKDANDTITIHVTEKVTNPECPVTLNMRDSYVTGEPLMVFAHYSNPRNISGWMNIRIRNTENEWDVIHDRGGNFNDYWDMDSRAWHSGTYAVEAEIWEDGKNEPVETYTMKTITVTTREGAGDVADFEVENKVPSISAWQSLNIRIRGKAAEGQQEAIPERYYVELIRTDDNGWYYDGKDIEANENGDAEITLDGRPFETGSQFMVAVTGMKAGYDSKRDEFLFVVTPDWVGQSLNLTVDGDGKGNQNVESSENLHIEVGSEYRPEAIRILRDGNWEYWYGDDEYERDWSFADGEVILYAEATWDNINFDDLEGDEWNWKVNWQAKSNVIVLNVTSQKGTMKVPTFTINENTELAWGEDLVVTITGEPAVATDGNVTVYPTTESWYACHIYRKEFGDGGARWERVNHDYDYPVHSGENRILTGNLEEGIYQVEIGADAIGYRGVSAYKGFTIGPKGENPPALAKFAVDGVTADGQGNLSAPTFANLNMMAYHSDAEGYTVEITRKVKENGVATDKDDEEWHDSRNNCRGGMLLDNWRIPESGVYTLTAVAYRKDQLDNSWLENEHGEWYKEIGKKVVTATATNVWASEVHAELSTDWAFVGDPITLTFTAPAEAEEYSYWIHEDSDERWIMGDSRNTPGSLTIDTSKLRRGVYEVCVDARATGYEESNDHLRFALIEQDDDMPTGDGAYFFNCELYYDETNGVFSAGTGDNFRMMYFVPGADEVMLLDGYDTNPNYNENEHRIGGRDGAGIQIQREYNTPGETHYIFGKYKKNGSWITTPDLLCTIDILGRLEEPRVDMPMVIETTDYLTIKIGETEDATNYRYWYTLEGDEEHTIASATKGENIWRWDIYGGTFEANRVYRFYFETDTDGYMNGHTERLLYVVGNNTEGINLDVPTNEVPIGSTFNVQANAPGADEVYIWWPDDNRLEGSGWEDETEINFCLDGDQFNDWTNNTRQTEIIAFARFGNTLKVKRANMTLTRPNGEAFADMPTLSIQKTTVGRNELIEATVGAVADAYEYHVHIFDEEENWCGDYTQAQHGTFLIPTNNLKAGNYSIAAYVHANGKYRHVETNDHNNRVNVTITEKDRSEFYVSKTRVQVCEPLTVSIYAPGAERVRFCGGYDEWNEEDGDNWYNDHVSWDFSDDEVDISAEAMYNGEWREIGKKHITIYAYDNLGKPTIHVPAIVTVPAESPLFITLDSVEHGERYGVNVRRLSDGWGRWYETEVIDNQITAIIPEDILDKANVGYAVTASVIGTGYRAGMNEATFVTVPAGGVDTSKVITLSADGKNAQSNKDSVKFTVTAPGATVIKIFHEEHWNWAPTDENGTAYFEFGFDKEALQPVWATACYDTQYAGKTGEELKNVNWDTVAFAGMSNVVHVQVWSDGQTWMPEIEVPETVKWGEWLPVNIHMGGNAELFHIRIHNQNGNEIWFEETETPGTYLLPTTMLNDSFEGFVSVCGMREGCSWNNEYSARFKVTSGGDQSFLRVNKTKVFIGEPVQFMLGADGMDGLKLVENGKTTDDAIFTSEESQSVAMTELRWETPGTHILNLYAYVSGEQGSWEQVNDCAVTIEVMDPQLAQAEIGVDDAVDVSQDVTITIRTVPNGENYALQVHQPDMETKWVFKDEKTAKDADANGIITFTIPADGEDHLEANASYWVDCYVSAPGFRNSDSSKAIVTVSGSNTDGNITVALKDRQPDNSGVYQIKIHEDFEVTANYTGSGTAPSAIAVYMGDRIEYEYFDGNKATVRLNEYQEWPETIFARAYYGEISNKRDEVPWDKLAWGNPTSILKVNFYATDQVGKPSFDAPGRITRGEDLYIQIRNAGQGANETHANISTNPPDEQENMVYGGNWQGWDPARQEIRLETGMLNAGRYWIAVDNSGIGLRGNREWRQIEVFENLETPEILVNSVVSNTGKTTIAVREVPNAMNYDLNIHAVGSSDEASYRYRAHKNSDEASNGFVFFTVPSGTLADGGYWIDCHVNTTEWVYYGSDNSRMFVVRNDKTDTDNKITISTDRTVVPINDTLRVNVSAPGAKAIIIRCGDQRQGYKGSSITATLSEWQPHIETMYAQACYDENLELPNDIPWNFDWDQEAIAWGKPSEAITIRFTSEGQAGPAGFNAPSTIARGEVMTIYGINPGYGANEVHANINRNGPDEPEDLVYKYGWHQWNPDTRTVYMSTSMLEPGEYWLVLDNSGIGYENGRAWHKFTVTAATTQSGTIDLSVPAKVQKWVNVPISVYAPGAVKTAFAIDLEEGYTGNPDTDDDNRFALKMDGEIAYDFDGIRWDEAGEHTVTAYAKFSAKGQWVTETKTVNVCEPISMDLSGLPGVFMIGQEDASITIPKPMNADVLFVQVYDDWNGGREEIEKVDESTGNVTVAIPKAHMIEGHQIQIDYQAYGAGFEECCGGTYIMIVPASNNDLVSLTIGGDKTTGNIQTNEEIEFIVSPKGNHTLTAVRFFEGHGYWWDGRTFTHENYEWWSEDGRSISFVQVYNHNDDPDRYLSVFAEVQMDGSNEWITTNVLRFQVRTPKGIVGRYDFEDMTPIYVTQGEPFEVTFTESENATRYWADVFDIEDDNHFDPACVCNGRTVTVSTQYLPEGEFIIRGRAVNDEEPGWRWEESSSERRLIVTKKVIPAQKTPTFVTPMGLQEIEEEAFAGIAAKVIRISDGCRYIGPRAFAGSQAEQIILPASIEGISDDAFAGCGRITVFGVQGTEGEWWANGMCYPFYEVK